MSLGRILSIDLEITRDGQKLLHAGAVLSHNGVSENVQVFQIQKDVDGALEGMEQLARSADFLLGHNILLHDLPWLLAQAGEQSLKLWRLPVIDTLFLSPLAFPKNPYHHLVKDYKLVRDSVNNPVADAKLALAIFNDQLSAFKTQHQNQPALIHLYHHLFSRDMQNAGLAQVFAAILKDDAISMALESMLAMLSTDRVCSNQLRALINDFNHGSVDSVCLAYAVAWLQVAGGNSVLPPWVWRRYPLIKTMLRQLREQHCGDEQCRYCHDNFDAKRYLNRFFELQDFRVQADGTPLQQQIIDAGIRGESSLGILPTGGGKSLCYQLPALVRNIRSSALTVVISPLQALMKDQVDNLKNKVGYENVAALNGMLTLPERSLVLEQIRMGDIAILYVSPEQLRNKKVKQAILSRQLGAWVFDEAHCLSKWGHDFRPDYLYCARVIAEIANNQQEMPAPVFCYTATAKLDVIEDISSHFRQVLNIELRRFEGGVERDNLVYEVVETQVHNKEAQILELLQEYFGTGQTGSCVIYCASRTHVETVANLLSESQELPTAYFHAGLEAPVKREILERFIAGDYRIIVATNAFGMGIDKDDVRLVIHYDIPGSLENYLQEAGRAGRDRAQASCILLFDRQDIEQQFKMTRQNEVRLKDIAELLKELRYRAKFTDGKVVATSRELLRSEYVDSHIDTQDKAADTKVKTAIAWLEREGFLTREDNVNTVFQGKPLFATLAEAKDKISELQLSPMAKRYWELILEALINAQADEGINADDILDVIIAQVKTDQDKQTLTPAMIMKILAQMADCGLVSKGFTMTAFLRPKGRDNAMDLFRSIIAIENTLLNYLPELAPDDSGEPLPVDLRALNAYLNKEAGLPSSTRVLRQLFRSWSEDGKLSEKQGSVDFHTRAREVFAIRLNRTWRQIRVIAEQRQLLTQKVLEGLYVSLSPEQESSTRKILVEFSLEGLIAGLKQDLQLSAQLQDKHEIEKQDYLLRAIQRALLFLDFHKCLELQNGMAVFKQAMEINVRLDNKERYQKANYRQLNDYYHQKVIQVHVMYEYARLGLEQIAVAKRLMHDYFSELNRIFLARYFARKSAMLSRATSEESWQRIVTDLNNTQQQAVVHARLDENQLVLAGPGAGKTRVVIHRIAYLMRVEQVPAGKILVLTFNHNAAISLHKRLVALMGKDGCFVRVHTFHGLAMRLLGQSFDANLMEQHQFDNLVIEATKLLQGQVQELGVDQYHQRSSVLEGVEHLLVDEYQDIDQKQYDFIAALAGKQLEDDEKLSLLAVGDDDQSIYRFRDANVRYIQQYSADYQAKVRYLTQNYRSTRYIIAAANSLIEHNQDRMKIDHAIEIDQGRRMELAGGRMAGLDSQGQGKVRIVHCQQVMQQANEVVAQITAIMAGDNETSWQDIAVLARHGVDGGALSLIRSLLHEQNIPYCFARKSEESFNLYAVREFIEFRQALADFPSPLVSTAELRHLLPDTMNIWHRQLLELIDQWQDQFGEQQMVVPHFQRQLDDYLFEQKRQTRFGSGVLLSTVHGVKGEEYRYVLVLDGQWQLHSEDLSLMEEERRLYYVAMTRAIDQLILFRRRDQQNPHIELIDPESCFNYYSQVSLQISSRIKFVTTGLAGLFLDYAGMRSPDHLIHKMLATLQAGDQVELDCVDDRVVVTYQDQTVAQIAKASRDLFRQISTDQYEARVIAMVRRQPRSDIEAPYQLKMSVWWLPIIEVIYHQDG